jgi:hypothetical protein
LPPVGTSGFGNPAVSAVNDQASQDTAAERAGLTAANREATRVASQFSGSGATGAQIGRGDDTFITSGPGAFDGGGVGDVIAPEGPVVTRDANYSYDGATGQAIG